MKRGVIAALAEIEDFVKQASREDRIGGFNVYVSRVPGKSYVLAKCVDTLKPIYSLPVWLDWANPVERPLIANAINKGLTGKELEAEELESEMVCQSAEDSDVEFIKNKLLHS